LKELLGVLPSTLFLHELLNWCVSTHSDGSLSCDLDCYDRSADVSRVAFLSWKLGFHLGNTQPEIKDDGEKGEGGGEEGSQLGKECNDLSALASSLRGHVSKVDGSLRVISSGIQAFNFPEMKKHQEKSSPSV
jgi:hypothetical protein